ncbi:MULTISPECIES: hypothetical protein [unclassified Pseudomonas]|uniref:hypothetical protein n=1 Tax=unclassified Pseudomonas TaxID=196821 RepID=UPI001E4828B1|nr:MULTISPECIES: hypothetical protein [unclassified Pseudomonas]
MIHPTFSLSFDARAQLAEHVKETGVFPLSLVCNYAPSSLLAQLTVEQCGADVAVQVRLGETVNTLTVALLDDTAHRVEHFLEELANSHYEPMAKPILNRDLQFLLTHDISEQDRQLLSRSVSGWRNANVEIDTAIQSEEWSAINSAQIDRSSHANTIALIVNKYTDPVEQGTRP